MFRNGLRSTVTGAVLTGTALTLSACGYGDSRTAHKAQLALIGMTSNDLQSCAGTPDKIVKLNATTQLFQYGYKPAATGAFALNPFGLGQVSYNGTGSYCTAVMRIDHDQVTEVHYTGDDDRPIGNDGICAPLVRGCIRQPEPTMRKINGGIFGPVSAFHSPAVPQQSQSAVWNGPAANLPALQTPTTATPGTAAVATPAIPSATTATPTPLINRAATTTTPTP